MLELQMACRLFRAPSRVCLPHRSEGRLPALLTLLPILELLFQKLIPPKLDDQLYPDASFWDPDPQLVGFDYLSLILVKSTLFVPLCRLLAALSWDTDMTWYLSNQWIVFNMLVYKGVVAVLSIQGIRRVLCIGRKIEENMMILITEK